MLREGKFIKARNYLGKKEKEKVLLSQPVEPD